MKCVICGKEVGLGHKVMIKGGENVCFDCCKAAGKNPLTWTKNLSTTSDELRSMIAQNKNASADMSNQASFSNGSAPQNNGTDNKPRALATVGAIIRLPNDVFAPYTSITTNILFFDNNGPTEETWFYRVDMPEGYKHFSKTKPMKIEHFADGEKWWNNREEICIDDAFKSKKFTAKELSEDLGYNFDQCGIPNKEEQILLPMDLIQQYKEKRATLDADIDKVLSEIESVLERNDQ